MGFVTRLTKDALDVYSVIQIIRSDNIRTVIKTVSNTVAMTMTPVTLNLEKIHLRNGVRIKLDAIPKIYRKDIDFMHDFWYHIGDFRTVISRLYTRGRNGLQL